MAHNYGHAEAAGKARARSRAANHLYYRMTPLLSRLRSHLARTRLLGEPGIALVAVSGGADSVARSEEHTSELQSRLHLVCRLLLEKKKKKTNNKPTRLRDTTDRV